MPPKDEPPPGGGASGGFADEEGDAADRFWNRRTEAERMSRTAPSLLQSFWLSSRQTTLNHD